MREEIMIDGETYLYDGILAFEPLMATEQYVKMRSKGGKKYSFKRDNFTRTKTSRNRIVFVIKPERDNDIKQYLEDHMIDLATRKGVHGRRWDELIPTS
jgi:hypothetical protein